MGLPGTFRPKGRSTGAAGQGRKSRGVAAPREALRTQASGQPDEQFRVECFWEPHRWTTSAASRKSFDVRASGWAWMRRDVATADTGGICRCDGTTQARPDGARTQRNFEDVALGRGPFGRGRRPSARPSGRVSPGPSTGRGDAPPTGRRPRNHPRSRPSRTSRAPTTPPWTCRSVAGRRWSTENAR